MLNRRAHAENGPGPLPSVSDLDGEKNEVAKNETDPSSGRILPMVEGNVGGGPKDLARIQKDLPIDEIPNGKSVFEIEQDVGIIAEAAPVKTTEELLPIQLGEQNERHLAVARPLLKLPGVSKGQ